MAKLVIFLCCLAVSSVIAVPASNEQLDKATVNDVAINTVSEDKKAEQTAADKKEGTTVQITGITAGADVPASSGDKNDTPFKPQRAGSMFARFIDDIFQIPITVLQNVAKLITNPFTQSKKTPEVAVEAPASVAPAS